MEEEVVSRLRIVVDFQVKSGRVISASTVLRRWQRKQLAPLCSHITRRGQLLYLKGCVGENLKYNLKSTKVKND
jgi:hypothetical protein